MSKHRTTLPLPGAMLEISLLLSLGCSAPGRGRAVWACRTYHTRLSRTTTLLSRLPRAASAHLARSGAKLESALEAGDINTELRAATRVLDYIVKLVELERRIRETQELEARITDLEIATEAASKGSGANGRRW
jgi:hypothetical protein